MEKERSEALGRSTETRLRLAELVGELSARLVELPPDRIDDGVRQALALVGVAEAAGVKKRVVDLDFTRAILLGGEPVQMQPLSLIIDAD